MPRLFLAFRTRRSSFVPLVFPTRRRGFRSNAALNALRAHSLAAAQDAAGEGGGASHLILYNYPSFSGAFAALFAHLYHSRLRLPFIILPFSSVEPFQVEDFRVGGFETCYLLDFIGPKRFALEISQIFSRVIAFDHRESTLKRVSQFVECPDNLELHVDNRKNSACTVYDYFSKKMLEKSSSLEGISCILDKEHEDRTLIVLRYLEDADLRRWKLSDGELFNIGLRDERAKLNCIVNPYIFEQLLEIDADQMIAKGKSYTCSRHVVVDQLLEKAFKIQLGRGSYGECLAIRADDNSDLSHELGLELSRRSASLGLRPIGAVIFLQRNNNLKMCLRSTDSTTNTLEIAKAYGGGGKLSSSSFIIRMDEYNHWTSVYT